MKRRSVGGSRRTGHGSSDGRPERGRISFSLTRRASYCIRWFAERGLFRGRRRSCGPAYAIAAASRPLGVCRSRPAGDVSAGIFNSTWIGVFGRRNVSHSFVTCFITCEGDWSWCGITLVPTKAVSCVTGCAGPSGSTWSSFRPTPPNSTPTSTVGRVSRWGSWPTTALKTWTICTPWFSRPARTPRYNRRFFMGSFELPNCLSP